MAYETSTFSTVQDLADKLSTFAVANGWTEDEASSGRLALTRSTVSVAFRWDTSSPTCIGIYQHTTWVTATDPGNHTGDSGQGVVSGTDATILTGRHCEIPNTGGSYWFFESDTYIHVVIEYADQRYNHFGFGQMIKLGTWTGGDYAYGTYNGQSGTSSDNAVYDGSTYLLDAKLGARVGGGALLDQWAASMSMSGAPNQDGAGEWALVWGGAHTDMANDRAGNERANCQGGFRGGPTARAFARFGGTAQQGLNPMYPINCWYDDPDNQRYYPIGYQPDVRGIRVEFLSGGDEIIVGSDTWVVFPTRYKDSVSTSSSTRNSGIAYKKVTT